MTRLLQRFGLWLAHWAGWSEMTLFPELRQRVDALLEETAAQHEAIAAFKARLETTATVAPSVLARAAALTRTYDATPLGGEAKRHAVYAQLIKDFPDVMKRELGLAIELALFRKEG